MVPGSLLPPTLAPASLTVLAPPCSEPALVVPAPALVVPAPADTCPALPGERWALPELLQAAAHRAASKSQGASPRARITVHLGKK